MDIFTGIWIGTNMLLSAWVKGIWGVTGYWTRDALSYYNLQEADDNE